MAMGFSWVFLFGIATAVLVFVAILSRRSRRCNRQTTTGSTLYWTGMILTIGLLFGLFVLFSNFAFRSVHHSHPQAALTGGFLSTSASRPIVISPEAVLTAGSSDVWVAKTESQSAGWDHDLPFEANIYPGLTECGRPLARKLAAHLKQSTGNNESDAKPDTPAAEAGPADRYRVELCNDRLDHKNYLNFLIRFRNEFRQQVKGSSVVDATDPNKPATTNGDATGDRRTVSVKISSIIEESISGHNKWNLLGKEQTGQVVMELTDANDTIEWVAEFSDKPWLAETESFVSRNADRMFVIGYSPRLASSRQEAGAAALKDALARLQTSKGIRLAHHENVDDYVSDRFVQKLTMPYGSVWREAVLIHIQGAETQRVARVAGAVAPATAAELAAKRSWKPSIESMLASLMLLTMAVGWICNLITQGYYRVSITRAVVTAAIAGFGLLLLWVIASLA